MADASEYQVVISASAKSLVFECDEFNFESCFEPWPPVYPFKAAHALRNHGSDCCNEQ